jgi:hypothetical protein
MFHVELDIRHRENAEVPTALTQVKSLARTRQWASVGSWPGALGHAKFQHKQIGRVPRLIRRGHRPGLHFPGAHTQHIRIGLG